MSDAFTRIAATSESPLIQLSCEHASNRMPPGFAWPDADKHLRHQHWAWDPGAAHITRMLAKEFGAPAVLSRFTRLLIDPNRELSANTLFRHVADGEPVALNTLLGESERQRRIRELYQPYHDAYDEMVAQTDAVVVSVHSFAPVYEGEPRYVEVGVLHDQQPDLGIAIRELLQVSYRAADNEPWDGRGGLMFAPQSHADAYGRRAVEFEVRQDLATDPVWRQQFVKTVSRVLRTVLT
ncbi:MAG: putative N-formylglutamate amidohydrolase [Myxococcota bacterium]|jgi:predicted N-formylglutamate amidohydrolase